MNRDGNRNSVWQEGTTFITEEKIFKPECDVVIIGGGITGLTTALRLQQQGKSCILIEANNIGFGTTGGTTAHLNTFFDAPYHLVIKNFSLQKAELLFKAAKDAIGLIKNNVLTQQIDCSLEDKTGYLFSLNAKQDEELDEIVASGKKVGLEINFINDSPFPIPYLKIASIENQAQFHPIKYIIGLAKAFESAGGTIVQNCMVTDITGDENLEIVTSNFTVKATHAVYATHIPPGVNLLHFRCAPYRSYAIAVKLKSNNYPQALGYDMQDPYHYYRTQEINGERFLIAGGEDHKTGHEENTDACFRRLESYVKSYFDVAEIVYRWSSQYFEPTDGLPYIGYLPGSNANIFVATGYGGNGMIYGTLAGKVLSDIIVNGKSEYQELFDPNRLKPVAGFTNFVKEAADVVKELIGKKFSLQKINEWADIAAGEAKVVKYEGHQIGLYKDELHNIHAVNAACTHIKCNIAWNNAEKTWDCPCHGSRFSYTGKVLTAPAQKPLEQIDIIENEEE
jgi:glycine/D-amino acid oxidase-like deaminating enzyme/nitrite reductase/ring-hydroxylating ferredoxin subunit